MVKKYLTPDFDVTVYSINDVITLDIGDINPDDENENIGNLMSMGTDDGWTGDLA